jgi:hypothetical protein
MSGTRTAFSLSSSTIPAYSGTDGEGDKHKPGEERGHSEDEMLNQRAKAREIKRRQENAKKAKEAADQLFPGEKWINIEEGIYLSPNRPVGKKSNFVDEFQDAQILRDFGSIVYLVQESSRQSGRKYDAIVNGLKMEFKNMHGDGIATLQEHFFTSRSQAPNVFMNLEKSNLTKKQIISALYGARNNARYPKKNKFPGGRIILKIKGQKNLIYLDVDSLKYKKP